MIFTHDRRGIMKSEGKTDICKSCGRTIGASERAIVADGGLICAQCEQELSPAFNLVSKSALPAKGQKWGQLPFFQQ